MLAPISRTPFRAYASAAILIAISVVAGCASNMPATAKEDRSAADPWEPMNRRINALNDNVDKVTLKPLAKAYEFAVPSLVRRGIGNFSANLQTPLHIVNNLLQGKIKRSLSETGRFVANSTFGIGGLIDIGGDMGMETYREDFGQTLAVWGVPDGPYVVLPLMGPSTLRDALVTPLNMAADPLLYLEHDRTRRSIIFIRLVDMREGLFAAEALIEDSFDRYLSIRESYLQNRKFLIYDGDPPEDEDFYDDFYDEVEQN